MCARKYIENVDKFKYLGIVLGSKMARKYHINELARKLMICLLKSNRVFPLVSFNAKKLIYSGIAETVLRCDILIWGNTLSPKIKIIEKLQLHLVELIPRNKI